MSDENRAHELEYEQINENVRALADVRFKLLALIPGLGGVAVFILTHIGLEAGKDASQHASELLTVLVASVFGLLVTVGITFYDQRNSQLYNALIHRAKFLERKFELRHAPGGLLEFSNESFGGQFEERPKRESARRIFSLQATHDTGLSLIYGTTLGVWLFPILYTVLRLGGMEHQNSQAFSAVCVVVAVVAFIAHLAAVDSLENDEYHKAGARDNPPAATTVPPAVAPDDSKEPTD